MRAPAERVRWGWAQSAALPNLAQSKNPLRAGLVRSCAGRRWERRIWNHLFCFENNLERVAGLKNALALLSAMLSAKNSFLHCYNFFKNTGDKLEKTLSKFQMLFVSRFLHSLFWEPIDRSLVFY